MSVKRSGQDNLKAALAEKAQIVNAVLLDIPDRQPAVPDSLRRAMHYTLKATGKRIRAALVLWCCEIVSGTINDTAKTSAAAVEMVHTYSLIHDDLPAMDDDDMRRGQPSCHKAFDEATAILAGDALLTMAFEILARDVKDAGTAVSLILTLAQACGPAGMVAGQMADLECARSDCTMAGLEYIHINKTAKMFGCSAAMGAIAGGGSRRQIEHLRQYGLKIGLGFQISDDILDVSQSSEHLGKTAGKDVTQGKITYPALAGLAESRLAAEKATSQAVLSLDIFGPRADILRRLAVELLERNK